MSRRNLRLIPFSNIASGRSRRIRPILAALLPTACRRRGDLLSIMRRIVSATDVGSIAFSCNCCRTSVSLFRQGS
jgi:hypothetical protein